MLGSKKSRTAGTNVDDVVMDRMLEAHIPIGKCKPGELFKVAKVTKAGTTSCWASIKTNFGLIDEILEATKGRLVNQKKFSVQLSAFLHKHGLKWALNDRERAAYGLRTMMRTLLAMKREGRKAPFQYGQINILIDKVVLDDVTVDPDEFPDIVEVPIPKKKIDVVEVGDTSDESDEEVGTVTVPPVPPMTPSKCDDDYLDQLDFLLFSTPTKPAASPTAPTPNTVPKQTPKKTCVHLVTPGPDRRRL
jgi:hypothetical protein